MRTATAKTAARKRTPPPPSLPWEVVIVADAIRRASPGRARREAIHQLVSELGVSSRLSRVDRPPAPVGSVRRSSVRVPRAVLVELRKAPELIEPGTRYRLPMPGGIVWEMTGAELLALSAAIVDAVEAQASGDERAVRGALDRLH